MKNQLTIGGKIGYLRPHTGKYEYAEITGIDTDKNVFKMLREEKQSSYGRAVHVWRNEWEENIDNVIKWLNEPSPDFKDGRTLLKYRGTNKLY